MQAQEGIRDASVAGVQTCDVTISTTSGTAVGPINFTVGDVETPAASLTVSGGSSNQTLMPDANIVLGGTGANRTVTLTPAAGQAGTAAVTLTGSGGAVTGSGRFPFRLEERPGGTEGR